MNVFELAWKEMQRENIKPSDKNYGKIWIDRVYAISRYISHKNRRIKK